VLWKTSGCGKGGVLQGRPACRLERRFGVRYGHTQEAAISIVTIVALGIWNGLLLAALVGLVIRWKQVLQWITQSDGENRNGWERSGADDWAAFLAKHPELFDR
jgi:hypothetical protein